MKKPPSMAEDACSEKGTMYRLLHRLSLIVAPSAFLAIVSTVPSFAQAK